MTRALAALLTLCITTLLPQSPRAAEAASAAADGNPTWQLVGRLGKAQYIVVPQASSRDLAYYQQVIEQVCPAEETCFLRFFTNSQNVPATLPLPDAIDHEATVVFSRTAKRGTEDFRWACRMQVAGGDCF